MNFSVWTKMQLVVNTIALCILIPTRGLDEMVESYRQPVISLIFPASHKYNFSTKHSLVKSPKFSGKGSTLTN